MSEGTIDYEHWYPQVPAVMDTRQIAELLSTNEQIVRAWVRDGIIPPIGSRPAVSSPSSATRSSTG